MCTFALMQNLEFIPIDQEGNDALPFYESRIQAGFPSPAQGAYADFIDLNSALVDNPASTFCARVIGHSMRDAGINEGDLLLVDRAVEPADGHIAVCFVDGDFTVKRVTRKPDGIYLTPANKDFPEWRVGEESNFQIWGVVTHIIKNMI